MNNDTNNAIPEYKTSHLPLATYLCLEGIQIVKEAKENGRGAFVFSNVPRELIIKFNSHDALVEPSEYAVKMSQLTHRAKQIVAGG